MDLQTRYTYYKIDKIKLILKKIINLFKAVEQTFSFNILFHEYLLKLIICINEVGKIRISVMLEILVCSLLGIEKLCGVAQKKKKGK